MCPDQGVLSAYLDRELMEPWRSTVDRHVEGCAVCTARLAGLKTLSRVLTSSDAPGLEQAMTRVRAALPREPRVARPSRWRPVTLPMPVALAAATLLMALGGALVYSLTRPAAWPAYSASRVVEAESGDIAKLLDRLNADDGARSVVFEIPADFTFTAFGEPQLRSIPQRLAE